ncbi:putative protease, partial [Clarias magur]
TQTFGLYCGCGEPTPAFTHIAILKEPVLVPFSFLDANRVSCEFLSSKIKNIKKLLPSQSVEMFIHHKFCGFWATRVRSILLSALYPNLS